MVLNLEFRGQENAGKTAVQHRLFEKDEFFDDSLKMQNRYSFRPLGHTHDYDHKSLLNTKVNIGKFTPIYGRSISRPQPNFQKMADAFVFIFSVVNPQSFLHVVQMLPHTVGKNKDLPLILIANKVDLIKDKNIVKKLKSKGLAPITESEVDKAMSQVKNPYHYYAVSAKSGEGFKELKEGVLSVATAYNKEFGEDRESMSGFSPFPQRQKFTKKKFHKTRAQIQPIQQLQYSQLVVNKDTQKKKTLTLVVGNHAKADKHQKGYHAWELYVDDGSKNATIESVTVKLHPTFKPNKVVLDAKSGFSLKRVGWGTFEMDVGVQFKKQFSSKVFWFKHELQFDHDDFHHAYDIDFVNGSSTDH